MFLRPRRSLPVPELPIFVRRDPDATAPDPAYIAYRLTACSCGYGDGSWHYSNCAKLAAYGLFGKVAHPAFDMGETVRSHKDGSRIVCRLHQAPAPDEC